MPTNVSQKFAAAAKTVSSNLSILHAETDAVLTRLASDKAYAADFYSAADANDRKTIISLLKQGGIKKAVIAGIESFPGNFKIKLRIDFKKQTIYVEVET